MKEITGFLQFVAEGNGAKAKEHFEAAMAEKVSKTLDARKVAVAHKHFNEETLEEAVVTRTLKTTFKYKSTPDVVVSKVHSGKDEKDLTKNYKKWEKLALDIAGKNEHGDKPIKVEVDAVKESVDASAESLEEGVADTLNEKGDFLTKSQPDPKVDALRAEALKTLNAWEKFERVMIKQLKMGSSRTSSDIDKGKSLSDKRDGAYAAYWKSVWAYNASK
jgi:hypothetical protein